VVLYVRPFVRLSVRHTRDTRLNGSRYRNAIAPRDKATFLVFEAKLRTREFKGSSRTCVLKERYPPLSKTHI